jgi:hypothetical protein
MGEWDRDYRIWIRIRIGIWIRIRVWIRIRIRIGEWDRDMVRRMGL